MRTTRKVEESEGATRSHSNASVCCPKNFSDRMDWMPDELDSAGYEGQDEFDINLCSASL
jgi:hypothetical protein